MSGFWRRFFSRKTTPEKYLESPRRTFWRRSHTTVSEDSSMQVAAFHRGVIYISSQIAKLPWDVKDSSNRTISGGVSDLLNLSPNPEMNSFRFRLFLVQSAIIHGNGYAEIERDGAGRPVALWPLSSPRMEVLRDTQNRLVYAYSNPTGSVTYLHPKNVYHLPNFHTKDGILGQGIVGYGREVLGIQLASDKMASGLFHNSGIPSGVITHPGKISPEAAARILEDWDREQGGGNSGSTTLLEEGMKYEPVEMNSEALQFLQSRQFGVLEISRFLGIPPTKLFDVTASTYSNVEQSNLEVATDTLDTWATNLELEADVKLLNNRYGGKFTDIDLYSIFRGDMKSRSDYFKTMLSIGTMTPNQIRAREGLPGYGPEGDNYYIATNNFTPVDRMDEVIDSTINKSRSSPATTEEDGEDAEISRAARKFLLEELSR